MESSIALRNLTYIRTINQYKNFCMEKLPNNIREKWLRKFVKNFENKDVKTKLSSTHGFVDELNGLESEYSTSTEKIFFLPFIESFLARVVDYSLNISNNIEDKKVPSYLYASALSKLYDLK